MKRLLPLLLVAACTSPTVSKPAGPSPRIHVARDQIRQVIAGDFSLLGGTIEPDEARAAARVSIQDRHGLLAQAGLKDGDLVTLVGGLPLTLGNALVLHGRLAHVRDTSIVVKRRGKKVRWRVAFD